jgi:F0F1-type ATP synthase assembly protein I
VSKVPGRSNSAQAGAGMGMSLAFEFAGAVALFWFLGFLVDRWLGIEPIGQVVGGVLGWIGGVLHVYYAVKSRGGFEQGRRTR